MKREALCGKLGSTQMIENMYEIVKKLIGGIQPVADSRVDELRFRNLESTCELVDKLMNDICGVARMCDRPEASVKKASLYAETFIQDLKGELLVTRW